MKKIIFLCLLFSTLVACKKEDNFSAIRGGKANFPEITLYTKDTVVGAQENNIIILVKAVEAVRIPNLYLVKLVKDDYDKNSPCDSVVHPYYPDKFIKRYLHKLTIGIESNNTGAQRTIDTYILSPHDGKMIKITQKSE